VSRCRCHPTLTMLHLLSHMMINDVDMLRAGSRHWIFNQEQSCTIIQVDWYAPWIQLHTNRQCMNVLNFLRYLSCCSVLCFSCGPGNSRLLCRRPTNRTYYTFDNPTRYLSTRVWTLSIGRITVCTQWTTARCASEIQIK
jgi:hypothetical protein